MSYVSIEVLFIFLMNDFYFFHYSWFIVFSQFSTEVLSIYLSFFVFSRAAPEAYGGSQARGLIRGVAASLRHSHSNTGSEPRLRPAPQLMAMPDP